MGEQVQTPKICLDRIDLNFREKAKKFDEALEQFLCQHRSKLGLPDSRDIITDWLDITWPQDKKSLLVITKLAPEEGKIFWNIRPHFTDQADGSSAINDGDQIPSFKVEEYGGHLCIQSFAPDFQRPLGPYDHFVEGLVFIDARRGEMGSEDLNRIRNLPHYAPSTSSRFAKWQEYLDWREKVTEENSKHRYSYKEWELQKNDSEVRFYMTDPLPVDLLKLRLQGQQLNAALAGAKDTEVSPDQSHQRRNSKATGAGTFLSITSLEGSQYRQPSGGKWALKTQKRNSTSPKPTTERIAVNVRLSPEIRRRLNENPVSEGLFPAEGELAVDVSGDMATLRNQRQAIERLEQGRTINQRVAEWIFNSQKARVAQESGLIELFDQRLNAGQYESIKKAMVAQDMFLLLGPPGTGKTTVIAELCRQTAAIEKRVLIASQANLAVDNALSCVFPIDCDTSYLRPLRILDPRREGEMEEDFRRFLPLRILSAWLKSVAKATQQKVDKSNPTETEIRWQNIQKNWIHRLKSDSIGDRSEAVRKLYARHANVIGVTCNQSGKKDFYQTIELDPTFDLVIVDEVSKATPPELLMPLLLGRRAVLVGDHRQLPPMFRSDSFEEAVANDLLNKVDLERFEKLVTASLFEELYRCAPDSLRHSLREQYRMHPHIMDAVNHFYPGDDGVGILQAGGGREHLDKLRQHELTLRGTGAISLLKITDRVLWVDSSVDERGREATAEEKRGTSRLNVHEINLIESFLEQLNGNTDLAKRRNKLDVGVISFYLAQTNALRDRLIRNRPWPNLIVQVNTVDQFQGRECSVVIVSLVRTGDVSGEFVKDYRRINVAFSRAKQLLIVVGSRQTFDRAVVPISPVSGGTAKPIPVYQEIAKTIAKRGGIRNASHIVGKTVPPISKEFLLPLEKPRRNVKGEVDNMGLNLD